VLCHQLNALPYNDYLATLEAKLGYMHIAFVQEGDHIMHSAAFKQWFAANEYWLVPYAQYSYLREAYNQPNFRIWPNHNEWTEAPAHKGIQEVGFLLLCSVHSAHPIM
jgi:4-alpha-glucanotransferase